VVHFEVVRAYFTQGQEPAAVVHLWLIFREKGENPATAPYRSFMDAWQIFVEALHP